MAIIRLVVCIRNLWRLDSTLNCINILQPFYFNVFLHGNLLHAVHYVILDYLYKSGDLYLILILKFTKH